MSAREVYCRHCKHHRGIPGNCHIQCANPPKVHGQIEAGGKERFVTATEFCKKSNAVVRCVWPGSGFFPDCFDSNTVFGCSNFEEGKPTESGCSDKAILTAVMDSRYGLSDERKSGE